jgi:tagaturonate reductase
MEQLCYETLEKAGYTGYLLKNAPERVLQFGEGNFLRAFADYWFDMANEKAAGTGNAFWCSPSPRGMTQLINRQEGLYTLYLRGRQNGEKVDAKRVISSVSRCLNPYEKQDYDAMMDVAAGEALEYIVSNTTEAGIVYDPSCRLEDCPPASFPAKLTQVLLHRWRAGRPGVVVLSCELIDNNGKELLRCVNQYIKQWGLEEGFARVGERGLHLLLPRWWTAIAYPAAIATPPRPLGWRMRTATGDALIDVVGELCSACGISKGPNGWRKSCHYGPQGLKLPVVHDVTPL